ncbi:MAG: 3',5'-cyclic-nucleotide phosphodiesterase [Gammaproteobacteria bacterium]
MMKVKILGASGGVASGYDTTAVLINDRVLLDAGTGAFGLPPQNAINDIVLSHSHLDHTAALCFLADNRGADAGSLRVYCQSETADALRAGIFNNAIWPDMERIVINGKPMIQFFPIGKMLSPMTVGGVKLSPFPVVHTVPTLGFCLHGERETLPIMTDLGKADEAVWKWLARKRRIRRMVIETSFPDEMEKVAIDSGHLTPAMLAELVARLPQSWKLLCCHIKPRYYAKVCAQIRAHFGKRAEILKAGRVFYL